ncbi:tRNA pseudouridine synthase B [Vulcanimicrobium alpinum]|uniref:tRNA pseudouridine synthase B n=1 Tax=Vulcanimicrobium alpinum TaxID=3016050 RepID=A0AAN1XYK3_UNVUL|nr:tRNA pseudouridine(55) synthase TruB [Vulcanimicrobium alpinum]BDE07041.1 tRNA pseudouridine synthase B [Vulcanimicrobium alpinum]
MLGFVNLFKPAGPSSTQFGARLRRVYRDPAGKLAIGHVGTLDPQAAGVLPIALGRATRLIPLITDRRKRYVCTLVLGRATTTGDATGETLVERDVPPDVDARLDAALPSFIGAVQQIPPMFSAVKSGGRRLYDLARAGTTVERKPRTITIYAIAVLGRDANVVRLRIACSEGTYVRTLCEDLAAACGTVGHMGALLREASGPFVLSEALTYDEVERDPGGALISPERVIPIPTVVLDARLATDFRAGRLVPLAEPPPDKHVFVRDSSRVLVGVGETVGALLAPRKVFV